MNRLQIGKEYTPNKINTSCNSAYNPIEIEFFSPPNNTGKGIRLFLFILLFGGVVVFNSIKSGIHRLKGMKEASLLCNGRAYFVAIK